MKLHSNNGLALGTSLQSTHNATSTPLGAGGTYTGVFEQNNYADIGLSCFSDVSGTLYVDYSTDGVNFTSFPALGYSIIANVNSFHTAIKLNRYVRLRYINGSSPQTVFRLNLYFGEYGHAIQTVETTTNRDSDIILVKNPYDPIGIARGYNSEVIDFSKFGLNASVGTTLVPITTSGTFQCPTAATSLEIVSTSANDTLLGSGARQITVIGLDSNFLEIEQVIDMNGTTPVAIPISLVRMYRFFVSSSGTYADATSGSHAGQITVQTSGAGAVWGRMDLIGGVFGQGQSLIACYTVPADKLLFLKEVEVSVPTGKSVDLYLFRRIDADDITPPYSGTMRVIRSFIGLSGRTVSLPLEGIPLFDPKTDLGFLGKTASGTSEISCSFQGFLFDA